MNFARKFASIICRNQCELIQTKIQFVRNSAVAPISLSKKTPKFHVLCVTSEGSKSSYEISKSLLYNDLGLTVRDLRFKHDNMLAVRNKKIIVRFKDLKAVICPDAVLVIDPPFDEKLMINDKVVAKFWENMPLLLSGATLYTSNLPFEYRALETIFMHILSDLTQSLEKISPDIEQLLDVLTDPTNLGVDRSLVHILLKNSASLNTFGTRVRECCYTLEEILECDDDIRDLCITIDVVEGGRSSYDAFIFNPHSEDTFQVDQNDSFCNITDKYKINLQDEMEMLLDSFLRDIEDVSNKIAELKESIENSNTAILINLDSHRNLLLRLELQLTMGMFSCTLFGMLGMAFGMNLESSWEENALAFWAVSGLMFAGAGVTWKTLLNTLNNSFPPPKKEIKKDKQRGDDDTGNDKNIGADTTGNFTHTYNANRQKPDTVHDGQKKRSPTVRPLRADSFRMDEFFSGYELRKPRAGNVPHSASLYSEGERRLKPLGIANSSTHTDDGKRFYHSCPFRPVLGTPWLLKRGLSMQEKLCSVYFAIRQCTAIS